MRELVDAANLRPPGHDRFRIHLLEGATAMLQPPPGNDLQALQLRDRVSAAVGLEVADHGVVALVLQPLGLLEHAERLPHTRGVAEEYLEATARGGFRNHETTSLAREDPHVYPVGLLDEAFDQVL